MITTTIFLGPPGVGKGTTANKFNKKLNFIHISTGNIFRDEVVKRTKLGSEVKNLIEQGLYVPDAITNKIVEKHLKKYDLNKVSIILDGYPRTISQARFLTEKAIKVNNVILFDAPKKILIKRLSGRRFCQKCKKIYHVDFPQKRPKIAGVCDDDQNKLIQRIDDFPKEIKKRLKTYLKQTKILGKHYKKQNILTKVNADQKGEAIFKEVLETLALKKDN